MSSSTNEMIEMPSSSDYLNCLEIELGLREKSSFEQFIETPCNSTLRNIPKRYQTREMVRIAVETDGIAIKSVSKKLITYELCKIAVIQNGLALKYIPDNMITHEIIELAVKSNGTAIALVPKQCITKQLAISAVCQSINIGKYDCYKYPISYVPEEFIDECLIYNSVKYSPCSIQHIPEHFITNELMVTAVSGDGTALKFIPVNKINKQLVSIAMSREPTSIQYVPISFLTKELCESAFKLNPFVLRWIPEQYISVEMCLTIIEQINAEEFRKKFSIEWIPELLRAEKNVIDALIKKIGAEAVLAWHNKQVEIIKKYGDIIPAQPFTKKVVSYLERIVKAERSIPIKKIEIADALLPPSAADAILVSNNLKTAVSHDLGKNDDTSSKVVFYISDLHIEHQLQDVFKSSKCTFMDVSLALDKKISEMLSSINGKDGYLLVAGDVGHYKRVVSLFYQRLKRQWSGTIISILGNHELWDDHPEAPDNGYIARTIDEIVADYRNNINYSSMLGSVSFLQNAVFIHYKNKKESVIEENQILAASDEDLKDICSKSSLIVLGGIGFSGLSDYFNANNGLYRSAVTSLDEDQALSKRFELIYDKMLRCAHDMQVIVLTHTPVSNWTSKKTNPNWIYINGHTHRNSLVRELDGTTVLSDNQIGYKPTKWKLNSFTISGWYDPFENMKNGVHEITSDVYKDFNCGHGIYSKVYNYPGKIFVLKKNKLYMFVLQSESSLCLLVGGKRKRLPRNDIQYYYDNIDLYVQKVTEAITPFQRALAAISNEVRKFGGWGSIHGCIIDIDLFNHIYLNPFDGTITPYYAIDIQRKYVYDDVLLLLKERLPRLCVKYERLKEKGLIPILSKLDGKCNINSKKYVVAKVPQLVLETDMYNASRMMKSFQYIFKSNVVRIWNDEILTTDFREEVFELEIE